MTRDDLKPAHIENAIRTLGQVPRLSELVIGSVQMAQMLAAPEDPNEAVVAGRRAGKTRANRDALYQPPWVEVPPPTVREGRAREWKRQTRADRKKMRQRRRGDRAGRPL